MRISFVSKFEKILQSSSFFNLIFFPFVSIFIYTLTIIFIEIDNESAISHVSSTARFNFIFILAELIVIGFVILTLNRKNFETKFKFFIYSTFALIIGLNLAAFDLSLQGVPLPPGDIRGDIGVLVDYSEKMRENWQIPFNYPPIYVSIIGIWARIFELQPVSLFKPFAQIIIFVGPYILVYLYKKIVNELFAIGLVTYIVLFSFLDWKNFGFYLLIGIVCLILNNKEYMQLSLNKKIKIVLQGVLFGIVNLIYFGNLWWILFAILGYNLYIIFVSRKDIYFLNLIYLGIFLILGPYFFKSFFNINPMYSLALSLFLIIIYVISNIYPVSIYISPFILFYIIFNIRIKESYFSGNIESSDPTILFITNNLYINLILIILISFPVIFYLRNKNYIILLFTIYSFIISSLLSGYNIAYSMQFTNRVDLWPRSLGFATTLVNLQIWILALLALYIVKQYIHSKISSEMDLKIFFGFASISLMLFFMSALGSKIYNYFPTYENLTFLAHKACDNPHVDPFLAKVFETRPNIQYFLRFNCKDTKWPYVRVLHQGPKSMLMNSHHRSY